MCFQIPAAAMGLLGSPEDWQYKTIPNNKSCLASVGRQCRFSRGKCLGGSTSINYMMYLRGNRDDYELGVPGWTWRELKPYFLRYEGLLDLDRLPSSSRPYHNTTGTMQLELFDDPENEWHSKIVQGLNSLGVPFNADANAQSQIGVTQVVGYVQGGARMTTARGYLARDDVRRCLAIAKHTHCTGVLIDGDNVATGITVVHGVLKKPLTLYATKEVILSAGAIGTPQILQLSGVGPAEHLKSFGIPVRADLPVGDNMSDHVLPLVFIRVGRPLLEQVPDLLATPGQAARYLASRTGPLASNGLTDVTALLNTSCYDFERRRLDMNSTECELPSLQLINAYIDRGLINIGLPVIKQATLLSDEVIAQLAVVNAGHALVVASPVVLRPHSRGTVRLASADPLAPPAIYPNYLGDERDVDEMLRSITILEQLVETRAYREGEASIVQLKFKGCPSYRVDREGYWRCYVRHMTYSVYHAVGTAALGAALDERLRVRGVARLRVADLSALGRLPRANTAAAAIAIGERVADFVTQDNK